MKPRMARFPACIGNRGARSSIRIATKTLPSARSRSGNTRGRVGRSKNWSDYVLEREDGEEWAEWLQTRRVELNAMTTPQFIQWLDDKMAGLGGGKLIPPDDVLVAELE